MSAPTGAVLAASAVVSSPILWLVYEGSISTEVAVQRWLVSMVICWVAISVVAAFAYSPPRPTATAVEATTETPVGTTSE
jgi:hypothetical protein